MGGVDKPLYMRILLRLHRESYGLHAITHPSPHSLTCPPPPKMLYGFSLYLLDLYGFCIDSCICMDVAWILYGCLGSVWILYGFLYLWISKICVHSVWMLYPYGFCMDSAWILLDSVSVWILYGFCMDPDDIHGFCLDSVWVLCEFYMDSVWSLYLYGFCMYQ